MLVSLDDNFTHWNCSKEDMIMECINREQLSIVGAIEYEENCEE